MPAKSVPIPSSETVGFHSELKSSIPSFFFANCRQVNVSNGVDNSQSAVFNCTGITTKSGTPIPCEVFDRKGWVCSIVAVPLHIIWFNWCLIVLVVHINFEQLAWALWSGKMFALVLHDDIVKLQFLHTASFCKFRKLSKVMKVSLYQMLFCIWAGSRKNQPSDSQASSEKLPSKISGCNFRWVRW